MASTEISFKKDVYGDYVNHITVTPHSTVEISDKFLYRQDICVITVDGRDFEMHLVKHEIGRPHLRANAIAEFERIKAAIDALSMPVL